MTLNKQELISVIEQPIEGLSKSQREMVLSILNSGHGTDEETFASEKDFSAIRCARCVCSRN